MSVRGQLADLLREADVPDQHPIDGLLEAVRHAGAMVRALAVMTAQLDVDPASVWETVAKPGGRRQIKVMQNHPLVRFTHDGNEAPAAVVALYRTWLDLYVRAARAAIDADLDSRVVRNATATSDRLFTAIRSGLEAARMSPEQRQLFSEAVANYLRRSDPELLTTAI